MTHQYSVKACIKCFGGEGGYAVSSEINQLHDTVKCVPLDSRKMLKKENELELASLMLVTYKRVRGIKGRKCEDGTKE